MRVKAVFSRPTIELNGLVVFFHCFTPISVVVKI